MDTEYNKVTSVECLGEVDDYVYDISIKHGDPFFFGNDILLHNTDSAYFSAYSVMKNDPNFADFDWSKDNVTSLYDKIADMTNDSFPDFMQSAFNCPRESGAIIRAGRELCALRGLFITKKRYAVLIYDKEGKRKDVNGKSGEIKVMGLDLKRSDTPKPVQDFLSQVLGAALDNKPQQEIFDLIKEFRKEFNSWPSWSKGSPKRVNNLTQYGMIKKAMEDPNNKNAVKKTIPGHVLSSLNWNTLREVFNDQESTKIQDGFKVIVCKLRPNPLGMTSVAYPVDQLILPDWFKSLPFDDESMEEALISKKVQNLLGVLDWNLDQAKNNDTFDSMFEF